MTGVIEVLWLGMLLGVGAALSVGPIFVVIIQQAATSGFGAAFRVILGSATADLVLLLPALAFAWIIRSLDRGALWVGAVGALFLLYLAWQAGRDAVALWRRGPPARGQRPLGVLEGGRRQPGQPPHLDVLAGHGHTGDAGGPARRRHGRAGAVHRDLVPGRLGPGGGDRLGRGPLGPAGRAARAGLAHGSSAVAFLCLAATLVARDVLPSLG